MMHPYEEMKLMKKIKKYYNKLGFVAEPRDSDKLPLWGGGGEASSTEETRDTFPWRKYFTSNNFKNDGLHFCQPWAFGVLRENENGGKSHLANTLANTPDNTPENDLDRLPACQLAIRRVGMLDV
ncbi:hypothetical protein HID58_066972 [Brassica napus]|uniref:Uncharacterized protein n=1 Tax=Brassica napus TaxID=3708 RepID=A0ABQ7ZHK9_BRANA|nr:hypothetical protein HID58_066972 [Brassica napus]